MLRNRNVAPDCQGMQVQFEKWFVIPIVRAVVVEPPSFTDVPQNTALWLVGAPKTDNAAMVFDLFPGAGVDVIVLRQGGDELIAIFLTPARKLRCASQFESDALQLHVAAFRHQSSPAASEWSASGSSRWS